MTAPATALPQLATTHAALRPRDLLVILLVAAAIRLFYLLEIVHSPFFTVPLIDAQTYDAMARQLAAGDWTGAARPFWQPPLYPYWLGMLYSLGAGALAVRLIQMAIGCATVLLIAQLGAWLGGRRVGLLAGLGAALYGPCLFFEGRLLPPVLILALNTLGLWLVVRRPGLAGSTASGLAFGLATIARPDAAVVALALAGGRLLVERRRAWRPVLCFLIALAVPVALVTIRNHRVGHDTVLVSANGGLNFYLGNNPRADATIALRPGREWRHLVESPHRQAGLTRPSERSRWFYARALAWMRDEPLAAAANLGRKVLRYAGAVEIRRNEDLYTAREESTVLSLLLWRVGSFAVPFGIVLPLAVVGGLLGWPERRRLWPLYVYLAAYVLVVVLFFVTARYRLPAVPVLLGFAALTVDRLPRLRAAAPRRLLRLALLALAVGVIANLGLAAPRIDTAGEAWRLRAIADYERGDLAAAIEAQTRAVERRPQLAELHYDLGVYRAAAGDPTGAIDAYRRALELDPDYAEAMVNLGRLLARQDSVATAVRLLVTAAAIAPGLPAAQIAIAGAFLHNGRVDSALAHYDRAIQLDPALPESWQGRGAALIEGGRPAEAIEALRHALDLGGEDAATLATLGRALKNTDRLPEALVTLRRALELERNPRTLVTLGQVYRDLDRLAEARDAYREALRLDPNLVQAHINIADVYVRQGLYDMARAALEVALRLEPRNTTALFNQAIVESRLGDTERARWFLRRVLELDPDHAPAKHALEVIDGDAAH